MPTERLLIIGAGGHAKVLVSAVKSVGLATVSLGVADDNPALEGQLFCGLPVITPVGAGLQDADCFHVAIGDNHAREKQFRAALAGGAAPYTVVHSGADVAAEASIGDAVFVATGSIVAAQAVIGDGVIVNHGAVVDHDCVIGQFTHIGPNATLGGACVTGSRVLIGAGANILPQVRLGDDATVGAGAVVLNDVPDGTTVVGVPARPIQGD